MSKRFFPESPFIIQTRRAYNAWREAVRSKQPIEECEKLYEKYMEFARKVNPKNVL